MSAPKAFTPTPTSGPEAFESTVLGSGRGALATPVPTSGRLAGKTLDHFRIDRLIGRGGMGAVYSAHDQSLDRPVAIKVLPDELSGDPELHARFLREARAQARLVSPHVVAIHHIGHVPPVGDSQGTLYFAMERVDGGALDGVLAAGKTLEPEEARRLMLEVARGLDDAVHAGIVHRDVKPSNLLRTEKGHVKIADFGLAKPLEGDAEITRDGGLVGSPLYMAPEQARGESVDHRADMYALGGTFFHLLSGTPLFDGPTVMAIVAKHLSDPAPAIRDRAPAVPPALATIISKLLAKSPKDRYPTYAQLIEALESAAPSAAPLAGFFTRAASLTVDFVVAGLLVAFLGWPGIFLNILYVTIAHATTGQTLAKWLFRLRVRRVDGRPLGLARASVRTVASMWLPVWIGVLILVTRGHTEFTGAIERFAEVDALKGLVIAVAVGNVLLSLLYVGGFLLAGVHPQKQALHDLVSGSKVVYRL